jgi:hypothetical protein
MGLSVDEPVTAKTGRHQKTYICGIVCAPKPVKFVNDFNRIGKKLHEVLMHPFVFTSLNCLKFSPGLVHGRTAKI